MSKRAMFTTGGLMLAVVMAPSCAGDAVGPVDGRTYWLEAVDGEELPITITPAPGVTFTLLADTIRFFGGHEFSRKLIYQETDGGADQTRVRTDILEGTVRQRDRVLVLDTPCEDVIIIHLGQCVPPDTVRTIGDRLLVRSFLPPTGEKLFATDS